MRAPWTTLRRWWTNADDIEALQRENAALEARIADASVALSASPVNAFTRAYERPDAESDPAAPQPPLFV